MNAPIDPRWLRLNDRETPCACCGQTFEGVYNIGFDHPDSWPHGSRVESGLDTLEVGEDALSSDLCKHGEFHFLRCTLPIPIIGTDEVFSFGPWGSLSEDSLKAYLLAEIEGAAFEGCFSFISNILPGCGMDGPLPADLYPHKDPTQRPQLFAHSGHPLAELQANGMSLDQLLDIYALTGNDLRPHLSDA